MLDRLEIINQIAPIIPMISGEDDPGKDDQRLLCLEEENPLILQKHLRSVH